MLIKPISRMCSIVHRATSPGIHPGDICSTFLSYFVSHEGCTTMSCTASHRKERQPPLPCTKTPPNHTILWRAQTEMAPTTDQSTSSLTTKPCKCLLDSAKEAKPSCLGHCPNTHTHGRQKKSYTATPITKEGVSRPYYSGGGRSPYYNTYARDGHSPCRMSPPQAATTKDKDRYAQGEGPRVEDTS